MTEPRGAAAARVLTFGGSDSDAADAAATLDAFLAPILRLLPDTLVRLRAASDPVTDPAANVVQLWSWLPLDVLVRRDIPGLLVPSDITVRAGELAAARDTAGSAGPGDGVALPPARDAEWRGALPPTAEQDWRQLDAVPGPDVLRLARAGTETFRSAARLAVHPEKMGRALLDHETIVVTDGTERVAAPLRVIQALTTMRFIHPDTAMAVSATRAWARFGCDGGMAYRRRTDGLALHL